MSSKDKIADGPVLPPKPDLPDCCAGGCATCVLMDYADEMAAWRAECARITAEFDARKATENPR
ncbi:oxidoreductase-like domain-containing protein [Polycyclovorans algicola]|uniref:oxidoreductase-like domain-containing protein n=1 Tax=Polycyclovorans algicola TaxID=616992 RepID=UPI0004A76666|nr:oxidoreductase-like domain-containing protein [Polycyclovorans algicola]